MECLIDNYIMKLQLMSRLNLIYAVRRNIEQHLAERIKRKDIVYNIIETDTDILSIIDNKDNTIIDIQIIIDKQLGTFDIYRYSIKEIRYINNKYNINSIDDIVKEIIKSNVNYTPQEYPIKPLFI